MKTDVSKYADRSSDGHKLTVTSLFTGPMERAGAITRKLMRHPFGDIFLDPVDPIGDGAPDYLTIINDPMDLRTIFRKLSENAYATWQDWASDVNLIFANCIAYNGEDSPLGNIALHMKREFEKQLVPFKIETYDGWIKRSELLYRRIIKHLKASPVKVRKTLGMNLIDETAPLLEADLEILAVKLSMLSGDDLLPVVQILALFGVEIGVDQEISKGKKSNVNLKTLPPPAVRLLAMYVKQSEAKRKGERQVFE
jgi:hypothetical protein